jgi:hypothetical protein
MSAYQTVVSMGIVWISLAVFLVGRQVEKELEKIRELLTEIRNSSNDN